jgi:hypothetical protein
MSMLLERGGQLPDRACFAPFFKRRMHAPHLIGVKLTVACSLGAHKLDVFQSSDLAEQLRQIIHRLLKAKNFGRS